MVCTLGFVVVRGVFCRFIFLCVCVVFVLFWGFLLFGFDLGFFCATQAALIRKKKIDGAGELSKYDHMAAYPSVFFQILLWK